MNFFGKNHRIFVIPPLALVLGVISFLSLNLIFLNWVETRGKDWLESTLTQKTGLPVSVGDINTSFPGLITLRDVEINNPSFLVLEKIDVRFFPWVLFHPDSRGMNFLHFAVQSSKLDLPSLPKDKSKQANKSQPVLPPFPISGKIKNFTVLSDKGEIPVSLSGDFHVGRKGGGGDFVLQSVLFKEGTASLKFNSSSQWETAAAVHGARFDQLSSYLPETLKSIEGAADFNLTASGTGFDFEDSGNVWGLEVHGARFRAELADGSLTPWLSGKAHLGQDKANVDLASQDGLTAKGEIKDPLSKKPLFLVNLEGNQVSFSSLQKSFPFLKFAPFEGVVDLRAKVEGELNDIAVSGQTTADLSRGKVKLPPVEANFSFQNGSFALDARSGKTQFILSGKKVPNGLLTYQSSLKNLELKKIGRLNDWANVNGKFDATFSGQWDPSRKPEFEGSFFLGDLKWGRKKSAEFIEGDFGFQKGHLWFDTENGALALKAEIEPDLIAIEKFKVQFQTNSYISAYGQVHLDDGTSSLNIKGQSIPPDLWPPLVHYYPEIEGSLDIEGTVNRNQKETFGKLTLLFHEIRFISEGHTWNGGGDFLWDQKGFQFKNTRIDGGYQGEVSWVNSTPEPVWGADVILDRADPDLLFELFHETKTVGGALTGQAQFTAQGSQFVGVSSLTWVNPLWGGVRADKLSITLENEGGKIKIPSGEIIRGESAVRLTGEIDRKSPAEIVFNLMIQAQQAGTGLVKFDGGAEFLGRLNPRSQDFEAKLRSDIIWINGYPFSNVDFKLENEKGIFKITGKDDENLSADLKYDSHHGYIKGTVKTGTLSVETLFSSILKPFQFKDNPVGEVSADLDFRGSVQSPLIQAKLLFPQLEWRQEKLNAQAFVVVEGTTVTLVSSRAELDSGGVLFAKGTLNAEKEGEINVDGVGSDIPLDSLFNFLKWPARWEGVTNASFEIKGPNKDRVFSIVFDGEHNGFGPFSNGGALSGTALGRGGEWDLGGITVNSGPGFVRLKKGSKVFVQKNQGGNMRLVADTRNLQLGALTLFGPLEVTGSWEGQSEVEESKKEPMEFDVFARSLWINQYVLNGNITRLRLKDKEVTFFPIPGSEQQISGILDYHEFPVFKMKDFSFIEDGVEKLFIDGQVAGPEWDFDIRARDLDARVAQGLLDLQAPMTGNMELRGTVKGAPSNPFIKGVVIWKKGSLFEIPVDFATAKVQVENGIVDVDRLLARKNDGYVLKGAVRFGTSLTEESSSFPPEISLRVENGDLRVLKEIFPSVYYSKGDFDGVFSLSGQGDNRTVSGFLNGEDLRFKSTSYIPSLKKGRVQVELSQDRLVVKEARARLHNGNAQLTGDILFEKGLPEEFNLNLFTTTDRGISIRVPDLAIPPGPFLGKFSLLKKKIGRGIQRRAEAESFFERLL